jgi:hypothetical protein
VHTNLPTLGGTPAIWDLSLGPNGIVYAAGRFTYSAGGKAYKNLIGIDPLAGAIAAAYVAPGVRSVLATRQMGRRSGRPTRTGRPRT